MKQLAVIGIDSLDPILIDRFRSKLPNIDAMIGDGPCPKIASVFPSDSIPAWISIFTGQHPVNHGIIHSFDVFQEDWANILAVRPELFKEKAFWNIVSSNGYKTCVLFPELCFPPWPMNGLLVCRSLTNEIRSYPESALTQEERIRLGGFGGMHPGKKRLAEYYLNAFNVTEYESHFALRISKQREWNLYFHFIAWLDIICHFFWRYMDENDPRHPGENAFSDYILRYYQLLDRIIGEFRAMHPDVPLMILSDHGHGMRPPKTVNVNVILRKEGFQGTHGVMHNLRCEVQEFLKRAVLETIQSLELDDWMLRLSKRPPLSAISKDIYLSRSLMHDTDIARLSSFAGPKTYAHGGIDVAGENMSRDEYESVRDAIIARLSSQKANESGSPLFKMIARREDILTGEHLDKYPDILFELHEGLGIYWATRGPLIGKSYEHNLSSGGHKTDGVLLTSGIALREPGGEDPHCIVDICPTILDIFGVTPGHYTDGRSLLAKYD